MCRETKTRMTPYFSLETMQLSRQWTYVFKVWEENAVLAKISFKNETKIKTFFFRHTKAGRIPAYPDYKTCSKTSFGLKESDTR